jgi:TfoX/Sxy family transcriptional regulator of competence genes
MQPAERFRVLCERFASVEGVTLPAGDDARRRFGSSTLKVNGQIFAMLQADALVLKLPAERVSELIDEGAGRPFGAGKGRAMREWVAVVEGNDDAWEALSHEALAFVSSGSR